VLAAVVVMEMAAVAGEEPVKVTDEGETMQVAPVGQAPERIRLTVPLKPFKGLMVTVESPDCPGAGIVMLAGFAPRLKSVTLTAVVTVLEGA